MQVRCGLRLRRIGWRAFTNSGNWKPHPGASFSRRFEGLEQLQGALDSIQQHDPPSYISLLRQCKTPQEVRKIQQQLQTIGKSGMVECSLLDMYCKVGSLSDANRVFNELQPSSKRRPFVWNIMLGAYCKAGLGKEAMEVMGDMKKFGVEPDRVTFIASLSACSLLGDLEAGKALHDKFNATGLESSNTLETALLTMYGKCGCVREAEKMFEKVDKGSVTCWNAMLAAYAQNGHFVEALQLYHRMVPEGVKPNRITFMTVLTAFNGPADLDQGRAVHDHIVDCGLEAEVTCGNALVSMYGKCGSQEEARQIFEDMPRKDRVSWNAMITAYVQGGYFEEAWDMYKQMTFPPDHVTYTSVLGALQCPEQLENGKAVHARIVASGIPCSVVLETALLNMYRKCGSLADARSVFEKMKTTNIVTWNAMIAAYAQVGDEQGAMDLYHGLKSQGKIPNDITFLTLLPVCSSFGRVREIHSHLLDLGHEMDVHVGNGLISAYGRVSSDLEDAIIVFENMKVRNVVTWTAMIGALVEHGRGVKALHLYKQMILEGTKPDSVAVLGALDACTSTNALTEGKKIHHYIQGTTVDQDVFVGSALVNLYGKCANVVEARDVFDGMPLRSVTTWNSMIGAYAQHGHAQESLDLYEWMGLDGTRPDAITFLCILFACSHIGQIEKARDYFVSMVEDYEIEVEQNHYCCMLDLLARGGWTHMAEDLISSMPVQPGRIAWTTLLGASNTQNDHERAMVAAQEVPERNLGQQNTPYVLLSSLYSGGSIKSAMRAARRLKDP